MIGLKIKLMTNLNLNFNEFEEKDYEISETTHLIIEEDNCYLEINNNYFDINCLLKDAKTFDTHIEITNGFEIEKVLKDEITLINEILDENNIELSLFK
jgi:hypothetical protein